MVDGVRLLVAVPLVPAIVPDDELEDVREGDSNDVPEGPLNDPDS